MQRVWQQVTTYLTEVLGLVTDWAIFLAIVVIGGYGTSWYMVEAGSQLTTQRIGPWVAWKAQARTDADPYTRAHFARLGTLDLSTETAATYVARTDDTGAAFDASCTYLISGEDLDAEWWSLTLFDGAGRLIPNAADRYSFTRDTIAMSPNGILKVSMARDAHDGNWLPFGKANVFTLVLHLLQPDVSLLAEATDEGDDDPARLLTINKVSCR